MDSALALNLLSLNDAAFSAASPRDAMPQVTVRGRIA
jgi:hypothetical protein